MTHDPKVLLQHAVTFPFKVDVAARASGAWASGSRVRKVRDAAGDIHKPGALGRVLGSHGPLTIADETGRSRTEFGYFVIWDDLPENVGFIVGSALELVP